MMGLKCLVIMIKPQKYGSFTSMTCALKVGHNGKPCSLIKTSKIDNTAQDTP